ncbi:hypothetical protein DFJ77DRAFT_69221 [Powellomyces hirtus]|nr:hypothetical protein DFJ77DRAFT_69221 [Powellomyces hirtus]
MQSDVPGGHGARRGGGPAAAVGNSISASELPHHRNQHHQQQQQQQQQTQSSAFLSPDSAASSPPTNNAGGVGTLSDSTTTRASSSRRRDRHGAELASFQRDRFPQSSRDTRYPDFLEKLLDEFAEAQLVVGRGREVQFSKETLQEARAKLAVATGTKGWRIWLKEPLFNRFRDLKQSSSPADTTHSEFVELLLDLHDLYEAGDWDKIRLALTDMPQISFDMQDAAAAAVAMGIVNPPIVPSMGPIGMHRGVMPPTLMTMGVPMYDPGMSQPAGSSLAQYYNGPSPVGGSSMMSTQQPAMGTWGMQPPSSLGMAGMANPNMHDFSAPQQQQQLSPHNAVGVVGVPPEFASALPALDGPVSDGTVRRTHSSPGGNIARSRGMARTPQLTGDITRTKSLTNSSKKTRDGATSLNAPAQRRPSLRSLNGSTLREDGIVVPGVPGAFMGHRRTASSLSTCSVRSNSSANGGGVFFPMDSPVLRPIDLTQPAQWPPESELMMQGLEGISLNEAAAAVAFMEQQQQQAHQQQRRQQFKMELQQQQPAPTFVTSPPNNPLPMMGFQPAFGTPTGSPSFSNQFAPGVNMQQQQHTPPPHHQQLQPQGGQRADQSPQAPLVGATFANNTGRKNELPDSQQDALYKYTTLGGVKQEAVVIDPQSNMMGITSPVKSEMQQPPVGQMSSLESMYKDLLNSAGASAGHYASHQPSPQQQQQQQHRVQRQQEQQMQQQMQQQQFQQQQQQQQQQEKAARQQMQDQVQMQFEERAARHLRQQQMLQQNDQELRHQQQRDEQLAHMQQQQNAADAAGLAMMGGYTYPQQQHQHMSPMYLLDSAGGLAASPAAESPSISLPTQSPASMGAGSMPMGLPRSASASHQGNRQGPPALQQSQQQHHAWGYRSPTIMNLGFAQSPPPPPPPIATAAGPAVGNNPSAASLSSSPSGGRSKTISKIINRLSFIKGGNQQTGSGSQPQPVSPPLIAGTCVPMGTAPAVAYLGASNVLSP